MLANYRQDILLLSIALGIWTLVLQEAGIIRPAKQQIVRVDGGYVETNIPHKVEVEGMVSVGNQVNVNLSAINGSDRNFYDFGGDGNHCRIPVMTTYPHEY